MPLVVAGLLLSSCAKEKKRITAEPSQPTDQRRTVPSTSTPPQSAKKPPVSPAQEPRDQKETARDNRTQSNEARVKPDSPTSKPLAEHKRAEQKAADAKKQAESVTPLDQSESEANVDVTQRIRQALLREDLSFAAKNVLVITQGDHVVLKGQVRSASEAERIKGIAGTMTTKRIEDVLEVRP
jgi:osmotically-inducible protein OsmY